MIYTNFCWNNGLLFTVGLLIIFINTGAANKDICSLLSCTNSTPPAGKFVTHCLSIIDYELRGHCCINTSSQAIIGIDLSFCHLENVKTMFHEAPDVVKIDLRNNHNVTFENTSFAGLKRLKSISVDSEIDCPGQWDWFNSTWQAWNVTEEEKHSKTCKNQTDTCELLKTHNYTCPDHSLCANNGPGLFTCNCGPGWGGYKCLRKTGARLEIPILSSVAAATLVASGFLWYTQRRHVL